MHINNLNDLEIIIPEEVPDYPGFYYFPDNKRLAVSKDGLFLNTKTHNLLKPVQHPHTKRFQVIVSITDNLGNSKSYNYKKARVLARTFIGRPSRHLDKTWSKLEVNHADGNSSNDSLDNLEWVTGKENIIHSHKNGLHSKDKQVLALNIITNKTITFPSTKDCADAFNIHRATFWKHLTTGNSGRYHKDWFVFKLNDNTPWNILPIKYLRELGSGLRISDFIITDLKTNQITIFESTKDAAKFLDMNEKYFYKRMNKRNERIYKDYHIKRLH